MARQSIAQSVRQEVLTEAGYRCAVPTCRTILAMDIHHIIPVADNGTNDVDNLIALCPTCHALHHRGEIPQEAIRVWKGMLVALNGAFDREAIDLLIFLHGGGRNVVLSGDGVLRFARLIASGLASIDHWGAALPNMPTYYVTLTKQGRLVVEAWRAGDRSALDAALDVGAGLGE